MYSNRCSNVMPAEFPHAVRRPASAHDQRRKAQTLQDGCPTGGEGHIVASQLAIGGIPPCQERVADLPALASRFHGGGLVLAC